MKGFTLLTNNIKWEELESLEEKLSEAQLGPGSILDAEWGLIEQSLTQLQTAEDWAGIIRLRELFDFLVRGETTGGMSIVQRINETAIHAAEHLENQKLVARYLFDSGENYHRQGYHRKSIQAFERAAELYQQKGESFKALESFYMMSLPYRALGKAIRAREILETVLKRTDPNDPWRGNPLQVMAWMERDERNFREAEGLLRESVALYTQRDGGESVHVVQTLADLGEVIGLQRRYSEAVAMFEESLGIVAKFGGQYDRQEARTKLKYAEMLIRKGEYDRALRLLDEADDRIRGYGHYYDLLWRVELARSFAFFKTGQWGRALRKLRTVFYYRDEIGLLNPGFVKQLFDRYRWGTAQPH